MQDNFFPLPDLNKTQQKDFDEERSKFYFQNLEKGKIQLGTILVVSFLICEVNILITLKPI